MNALDLLNDLRQRGVMLRADAGDLVYRAPLGVLDPEDLAHLRDAKPDLLPVLEAEGAEEGELAWRQAAMAPQLPARGPIPLLIARVGRPEPGVCPTCDGPLDDGRYRCRWCVAAARRVILSVREGVTS